MEIDYPPEPAPGTDPKVRYEWITEMKRLNTERRNDHSTRCDVNFKVEIARAVSSFFSNLSQLVSANVRVVPL
jgi:DNA-directed RNA polymerase